MRFFHLSDLHIGLKLINRDLSEDQAYIFRQIVQMAEREQPDALVIAGDIYDKAVPSAESVMLFDRFVSDLHRVLPKARIMMISGNHDSAPRVNVFRSLLESQNVHMIGLPPQSPDEYIEKVTLTDDYGAVNFYLLPFVRPSMIRSVVGTDEDTGALTYDEAVRRLLQRESIDTSQRNVLVSHQFYVPAGSTPDEVDRMDSEIRTVGNIDEVKSDVLAPFDYAALGHIHKPMRAGGEYFRYCGTPLACSVSEAGQQKGILDVTLLDKGDVRISVLPLTPMREVKVLRGELEELLRLSSDDYVSVTVTDPRDIDVIDMMDRLHHAFGHLLEIRRQTQRQLGDLEDYAAAERLSPIEMCQMFLGEADEEDEKILKDVFNTVSAAGEEIPVPLPDSDKA